MGSNIHGFNKGAHDAEVHKHVRNIPGKAKGGVHGGGAALPAPPAATPHQHTGNTDLPQS